MATTISMATGNHVTTAPQVVNHNSDHMTLITEEARDNDIVQSRESIVNDINQSDETSGDESDYDVEVEMTEVWIYFHIIITSGLPQYQEN